MDYRIGRLRSIRPVHDLAAAAFNAGQAGKCRTGMHDHIRPGHRVLFAGVGQGWDVISAAERGARVTVVDISRAMLDAFSKRISGRRFLHPVEIIHGDIFTFEDTHGYDIVFANFFLDLFPRVMVFPLIEHLAGLIKRGGHLVISDFAPPSGWIVARAFQNVYWYFTDIFHHITDRNAIHPVHDYREMLEGLGLSVDDLKSYRYLFDRRYLTILATKH